ncbi:helix-turn-helix domain-containing protein [Paenibacillus sinopodophylli]|uniref:helix-turn-helix domain-containing protein n=1 Tax=Paenibacillus sinopodophylli TaxID=1837342 RepID=UPI00110CEB3F|nr:AraC family transcriptional regulator [Paenibacillus sinopodophylli]
MTTSKYYEFIHKDLLASHGTSSIAPTKDFHVHDNYEIYLFLDGEVNLFINQFCYHLQRGNLLVINNHEIHKVINLSGKPYERMTIHFKPDMIQPFCSAETNLLHCFINRKSGFDHIIQLDESQIEEFIRISSKLIHALEHKTYGSDVLSLTFLVQILVFTNDAFGKVKSLLPRATSSFIHSVMQYIENNLRSELSLEQISKKLSVDKFYLSHMFKSQTGGTIYHYILMKRVALAKQLLADGHSVSLACHSSGFNDYANFIRTFKKISGISPGKYAKLSRSQSQN